MPEPALDFAALVAACQRQDLPWKANHETRQLAVLHRVGDQDAPLYLIPEPDRGLVAFVLPMPFRVPADRAPALADALTRLHRDAPIGTWRLAADGELSLRAALPSFAATYRDEALWFLARLLVAAAEAAAPALARLALDRA
jgi:hypothetical protein